MNRPDNNEDEPKQGWLIPLALVVFTVVNTYRLATVEGEWGLRQWAVLGLTAALLFLLWREYKRFKTKR